MFARIQPTLNESWTQLKKNPNINPPFVAPMEDSEG